MQENTVDKYWVFICDPQKWKELKWKELTGKDFDDFLGSNPINGRYKVSERKDWFKSGQKGVILVSNDKRTKEELGNRKKLKPGIYAIVEILSETKYEEGRKSKSYVDINYSKNLLHSPLLKSEYESLGIILPRSYNGSNKLLEKKSFELIEKLIENEQTFQSIAADSEDGIIKLEEKCIDATPEVKYAVSKRIERGLIANKIKKQYAFKCKVCEALGQDPYSFKKVNGEFYVETHHINQVSNLAKGSLGSSNLITVCANHHRQIHYGNVIIIENKKDSLSLSIDKQEIKIGKIKFVEA